MGVVLIFILINMVDPKNTVSKTPRSKSRSKSRPRPIPGKKFTLNGGERRWRKQYNAVMAALRPRGGGHPLSRLTHAPSRGQLRRCQHRRVQGRQVGGIKTRK